MFEARARGRTEEAAEARRDGGVLSRGKAALLDLDPELRAALMGKGQSAARRELVVETVRLERGTWADELSAPELFGVLVVEGALIRRVFAGGGQSLEILTAGDFARPAREEVETFGE